MPVYFGIEIGNIIILTKDGKNDIILTTSSLLADSRLQLGDWSILNPLLSSRSALITSPVASLGTDRWMWLNLERTLGKQRGKMGVTGAARHGQWGHLPPPLGNVQMGICNPSLEFLMPLSGLSQFPFNSTSKNSTQNATKLAFFSSKIGATRRLYFCPLQKILAAPMRLRLGFKQ